MVDLQAALLFTDQVMENPASETAGRKIYKIFHNIRIMPIAFFGLIPCFYPLALTCSCIVSMIFSIILDEDYHFRNPR